MCLHSLSLATKVLLESGHAPRPEGGRCCCQGLHLCLQVAGAVVWLAPCRCLGLDQRSLHGGL